MNEPDPALAKAEATLVGCLLNQPDFRERAWETIRAEDLNTPHRQIAEAIHGLHLRSVEVSVLSVIDEMTKRGTLGRIGGAAEVFRTNEWGFGDPGYALDVVARHVRLRRIQAIGARALQVAGQADADPHQLAVNVAHAAQAVVDGIEAEGDVTTMTLGSFLETQDDPFDWVIPGLLEHGDRLILTGSEGLGKSVLCRQIAVCAAAGVHPFTHQRIAPQRVLLVDCENGPAKLRRALRSLRIAARQNGSDPDDNMWVEAIPAGLDLTKPEDELWLVRRVTALQPDLLVTGPIYRLHAANPNDEEPARKVTQVLDRCRAASGCALMTEAHTSHGQGGADRPLRPTGSSLWLRWPEFGYGIKPTPDFTKDDRQVMFTSWRGDREERSWPIRLRSGTAWPWEDDAPEPMPRRSEMSAS